MIIKVHFKDHDQPMQEWYNMSSTNIYENVLTLTPDRSKRKDDLCDVLLNWEEILYVVKEFQPEVDK